MIDFFGIIFKHDFVEARQMNYVLTRIKNRNTVQLWIYTEPTITCGKSDKT